MTTHNVTIGQVETHAVTLGDTTYNVTIYPGAGAMGDGIPDAPGDGSLYARFNATWASVSGWLMGDETEKVEGIQFDTTADPAHSEGMLHWDDGSGTLELGMPGGNVSLQIGQEHIVRVRNTTGSTILNGAAIYLDGAQGIWPLIKLSRADAKATTILYGVATEDINHN
ncbi:MAG: hypothetical protein JRC86_02785, partial [Deltaproteobacteria bacterium]|nr:hypothetical protein [Deltaproteobacteria bacterium]